MKTTQRKTEANRLHANTLSESNCSFIGMIFPELYFLLGLCIHSGTQSMSYGRAARATREHFNLFPTQNCERDSSKHGFHYRNLLGLPTQTLSKIPQNIVSMTDLLAPEATSLRSACYPAVGTHDIVRNLLPAPWNSHFAEDLTQVAFTRQLPAGEPIHCTVCAWYMCYMWLSAPAIHFAQAVHVFSVMLDWQWQAAILVIKSTIFPNVAISPNALSVVDLFGLVLICLLCRHISNSGNFLLPRHSAMIRVWGLSPLITGLRLPLKHAAMIQVWGQSRLLRET